MISQTVLNALRELANIDDPDILIRYDNILMSNFDAKVILECLESMTQP